MGLDISKIVSVPTKTKLERSLKNVSLQKFSGQKKERIRSERLEHTNHINSKPILNNQYEASDQFYKRLMVKKYRRIF